MEAIRIWINRWLSGFNLDTNLVKYISMLCMLLLTLILISACLYITTRILRSIVGRFIAKTRSKWDDALLRHKLFRALSYLVAVLILKNTVPVIFYDFKEVLPFVNKVIEVYFLFVIIKIVIVFLRSTEDYLSESELFKEKPIASYFQLVRMLLYIVGAILGLSILLSRSPLYFIGAFGAMTAVILLIFKDTILGLVASIQISANDMVRIGDWVEMPKYNADGDVIAINLNTIKIKNWDKTITTVPTHYFITDSFKNWRGMQTSGGRRIKRTIQVHVNTIRFVDPQLREQFKKIQLITDYIASRQQEIEDFNKRHTVNAEVLINGRRMTNIGVFRVYIERYLAAHPGINHEMTCMVRQLTATESGLPVEVYCFTKSVKWAEYEQVQSDIFDHLFASAPQFGLTIFQSPSGSDFRHADFSDPNRIPGSISA